MNKKFKKTVFWGLIALALMAIVGSALRKAPVKVDVGNVTLGPLAVTVDEDGETRVKDPYLVSSPLAGRLLRVNWKPGDAIKAGEVLLTIDPGEPGLLDVRTEAEAKARVGAAEANLKRAQSEADAAAAEVAKWDRYLLRDEARLQGRQISLPVLEDTRHGLRVAKSNLSSALSLKEASQFEREMAQAALYRSQGSKDEVGKQVFQVRSPINGVVLRKFVESSIMISPGQRILEIGDPSALEIRIDVLSQDAVKIRPGQKVYINHWGGDGEFAAFVRRVEPSAFTKVSTLGVEEQRVYILADLAEGILPEGILGDGYRIEARIVVWENENVLKIPSGALFRSGDSWSVFVFDQGRARLRTIATGKNNGIDAEVLTGLTEGEKIVLHPGDRVTEGIRVQAD